MPCVLWGCAQLVLNSSIHPSLGIVPGCSYFHFRSGLFREQKMSSKLHSPQRDVSREAALSGLCIVNFWGLFPQRGGSSPGFSIHIKLWSIKQGRRCFNCRWCFKQMKSCKTAKDVFPEEKNSQEYWQVPIGTKVTVFSLDMSKYPLCTECLFITIVCCQILWKVSKFESARPRQLSAIEVDALWGFYQVKSFVVFYSEGCNVSVLCSLSGTLEVPLWTESVL